MHEVTVPPLEYEPPRQLRHDEPDRYCPARHVTAITYVGVDDFDGELDGDKICVIVCDADSAAAASPAPDDATDTTTLPHVVLTAELTALENSSAVPLAPAVPDV